MILQHREVRLDDYAFGLIALLVPLKRMLCNREIYTFRNER